MKKGLLMFLALVLIVSLVPVFAFAVDVGATVDKTVNFHHGYDNGGSRVWPLKAYPGGDQWFSNSSNLPTETLEYQADGKWKLLSEAYYCPECGSNEWIAYSNQSDPVSGNNVQLCHPGSVPVDPPVDPPDDPPVTPPADPDAPEMPESGK